MLVIDGYHGTSKASSQSILATQFNKSISKKEWLGHGIYFFVEGVTCPVENARIWVTCQSWDKIRKIRTHEDYAILKSVIHLNEDTVIDLTSLKGLQNFNVVKEAIFLKLATNLKLSAKDEHNCILFNYISVLLKSQAVKHHLYIKNKRERMANLLLNVPNTTVLCVIDQSCIIDTEVLKEGKTNE